MIKTDKEAFEFVVAELIKQNQQSLDSERECAYRGFSPQRMEEIIGFPIEDSFDALDEIDELDPIYSDLRCAVGYLIADDYYSVALERNQVDNILVTDAVQRSNPEWKIDPDTSIPLLRKLQLIHDSYPPSRWVNLLDKNNFSFNPDGSFINTK